MSSKDNLMLSDPNQWPVCKNWHFVSPHRRLNSSQACGLQALPSLPSPSSALMGDVKKVVVLNGAHQILEDSPTRQAAVVVKLLLDVQKVSLTT